MKVLANSAVPLARHHSERIRGRSSPPGFPVRLVCPSCKSSLQLGRQCPCSANTRIELWKGIPRSYFGQEYFGECSPKVMKNALALLESHHWKAALDAAA